MAPGPCVHASSWELSSGQPSRMSLHLIISRTHSIAEMAPGSCVHASSWAINSSVDPENFHPDDLQQCVSPPHHLNHSFPVSSLGNSIPCWGLLSAQYLRALASDQSWSAQFLTKGKLVHSHTLLEDVTHLKSNNIS